MKSLAFFERTPRLLAVLFLLSALVTVGTRLYTFRAPPQEERDIAMYAVVAHEMFHGRPLYSGVFEHKLPGMYWIYGLGESLFGYDSRAISFVSLSFALLGLAGVYYAASAAGWQAGAWAMLLWALLSGDVLLEGNQPNAELFLNVLLVLAFGIFLRLSTKKLDPWRCLALGALMALVVLIKQFLAILLPIVFVARWMRLRREPGAARLFAKQLALACAPVAAGILATVGYFALSGRGTAMYEAVVGFNRYYAGNLFVNVVQSFKPRHLFRLEYKHALIPTLPLFLFAVVSVARAARVKREPVAIEWLAFAVFTALAVGLPGRFYEHYQQYWLVALAVGGGIGIASLGARQLRWGALVLVVVLATQLPYYFTLSPSFGWRAYVTRGPVSETGREIEARLSPDERFYAWTVEPGLYFYSKRGPISRQIWCDKLDRGPYEAKFRAEVYAQLLREKPRLIVVDTDPGSCPLSAFPQLETLLARDYQGEAAGPRFTLYWRRESQSASR